ncbi:MAG: hypothetical protein PHS86_12205 [Syntrophaceae bacterium]|nr:hypothetical protein [Syntrophaceae bacterium]
MAKKIVGGIYYLKVWQGDTQREQFKIYVYICEINGKPVFVKVNSKYYSWTVQTTIYKKDYPNIDIIQEEKSFIDCARPIRGISLYDFDSKCEKGYQGSLCLLDLINLNITIKTVKTLSPKEKKIIEDTLNKRISELL